jgi:DHA2 family multidrug resistance protein
VGIALLSTLLSVRESFHASRIAESLSLYSPATRERIDALTQGLMGQGLDATTAGNGAMASLVNTVHREAYVMAFNDSFFMVAIALVVSSFLMIICDKVDPTKGAEGAH